MSEWRRVVMAAECYPCPDCGELICPKCAVHYADCKCPGPCMDEMEYRMRGGELWAHLRKAGRDK